VTAFISGALLLALGAVLLVALPLVRGRPGLPPARTVAAVSATLIVVVAAALYMALGHWRESAVGEGAANQTISRLARDLESDPQNVTGWIMLGQAYTSIGQYPLAIRAYNRANRLTSSSEPAALAGLGEAMTLSGDATQAARAAELFERALQLDPKSPKALFYSAVAAYDAGRLDIAHDRFEAMLELNPPENVRIALQKQITAIDGQLHQAPDPATAIHLHVTLAPALAAQVPANASLFVFVRAPQGGAPLAVKRSAAQLPQDLDLSARDAMIAGHGVQPGQQVAVVARISASGAPLAQTGDLYGEIRYQAGKEGVRNIVIGQRSP
jgi:cytochrome c-type biogenesis protein CcmH